MWPSSPGNTYTLNEHIIRQRKPAVAGEFDLESFVTDCKVATKNGWEAVHTNMPGMAFGARQIR
jgi:hypothetical protein